MNSLVNLQQPDSLTIAKQLADEFSLTAAERDIHGGTPKTERDAIRHSGLLALIIPKQFGGLGANWQETLRATREIARADSSLAHVFGFQHLMLATIRLFAKPEQWEPWFTLTAKNNWFWGNALNPLDKRTQVRHFASWCEFSGKKSFCSGATDSEMLIASAVDEKAGGKLIIAAIPSGRTGITFHNDWDNIGQRQTDSGSATFERVRVEHHELLLDPGPLSTPFACLRPLIAQLLFANLFLGVAEGAFEQAKDYTLKESRPWFLANADSSAKDPYILRHYGEFWVALESMRALVERAADALDHAWAKGHQLSQEERAKVAIAVGTAKVATTRHALDICNRLFEVTGARATHGPLRFDRFWRNIRTQTLHDPVDYRIHELGEWALNGTEPTPSFYS